MKKGSWVECPVEECECVRAADGVLYNVRMLQYGAVTMRGINLESTRVYEDAFKSLCLTPVKFVEEPLVDMVLKWEYQINKGSVELIFTLPFDVDEKFINSIKGDKFRLIEVIDGE